MIVIKIVIKDFFLKLMFNILKNFMNFKMINLFYWKKNMKKVEKPAGNLQCCTHNKFKTRTKSWVSIDNTYFSD